MTAHPIIQVPIIKLLYQVFPKVLFMYDKSSQLSRNKNVIEQLEMISQTNQIFVIITIDVHQIITLLRYN